MALSTILSGLVILANVLPSDASIDHCDPPNCPLTSDFDFNCNIGNSSVGLVGITSFDTPPLTWAVGIQLSDRKIKSPVDVDRNYYLGTPKGYASENNRHGCAFIFEGITKNDLVFKGAEIHESSNATCIDALDSQCVTDLPAYAQMAMQLLSRSPQSNSSICEELGAMIKGNIPQSCRIPTGKPQPLDWDNIVVRELFQPNDQSNLPIGNCYPTTQPNYDISLVSSYRRTEGNASILGVTPILTTIYNGNFTKDGVYQANSSLSCVRPTRWTGPPGNFTSAAFTSVLGQDRMGLLLTAITIVALFNMGL